MLNISISLRMNSWGNAICCRGACADRRQALEASFDPEIFA
ncbi:hypothetical protein [Bradyrhizobium sp. CCGB01]|nr:hypothetical protein [Bradyrhizobium sp. CCGB01]